MSDPAALDPAASLFRNDADYFRAGASSLPVGQGSIRWMPGLQHLAAGCILEPGPGTPDSAWLREAAAAARSIGASLLRFYRPDRSGDVDLSGAGLVRSTEIGMARQAAGSPGAVPIDRTLSFRPVRTTLDWAAKQALAGTLDSLPDGKRAEAADWTRLERLKSEAGFACFWLAERGGVAVGTFGLSGCGSLLRIKNLAVDPAVRRSGIGRAIVAFAIDQARRRDLKWVGAFAIQGGAGRDLYDNCGFEAVGAQSEWSRSLAFRTSEPRVDRLEQPAC